MRMTAVIAALLLPFVAACDSENADEAPSSFTTDSAGIRITENSTPLWSNGGWQVDSVPIVRLGMADGDATQLLWQIAGARRLADGSVAVLSSGALQVLLFDSTGALRRAIGREGRGPGEFAAPAHIETWGRDSLIVWEHGYGPITWFDTAGHVLRRDQIDLGRLTDAVGRGSLSEVFLPLRDGSMLVRVSNPAAEAVRSGATYRQPISFKRVRPDFSTDSLGVYHGMEQVMLKRGEIVIPPIPLFPAAASAAAGGTPLRIFISDGQKHEIHVYDHDGVHTMTIRRTTPLLPISPSERRFAEDWTLSRARDHEVRSRIRAQFAAMPRQTHHPAIGALIVDERGYVWTRDRHGLWSVYDRNGRWLGQVTMPLLRVYEIGADYVLGMSADDDGVESVQVHRLRRY